MSLLNLNDINEVEDITYYFVSQFKAFNLKNVTINSDRSIHYSRSYTDELVYALNSCLFIFFPILYLLELAINSILALFGAQDRIDILTDEEGLSALLDAKTLWENFVFLPLTVIVNILLIPFQLLIVFPARLILTLVSDEFMPESLPEVAIAADCFRIYEDGEGNFSLGLSWREFSCKLPCTEERYNYFKQNIEAHIATKEQGQSASVSRRQPGSSLFVSTGGYRLAAFEAAYSRGSEGASVSGRSTSTGRR